MENTTMKLCPNCGIEHDLSNAYCAYCGTALVTYSKQSETYNKFCTNCGYSNTSKLSFCPNCGNSLKLSSNTPTSNSFPTSSHTQINNTLCSICGTTNKPNTTHCSHCGSNLSEVLAVRPSTYLQHSNTYDGKKHCANCGGKLSTFNRTRILNKSYICTSCFSYCSNYLKQRISSATVSNIKKDIARMHEYPNFSPTHHFGNISVDSNNNLLKTPGYPVFKLSDIIDFEVIDERQVQTVSYTKQNTKTHGGLGGAVVGGVLFGPVGAVVGGVTAKRRSVTMGNTQSSSNEYFTRLGIRLMLRDLNYPSIAVDFINTPISVNKARQIVDDVNNAIGLLNMVLNSNAYY